MLLPMICAASARLFPIGVDGYDACVLIAADQMRQLFRTALRVILDLHHLAEIRRLKG